MNVILTPTRSAESGAKGGAALRGMARQRDQCSKCGRWFAGNGIFRHRAYCKPKPIATRRPQGHTECGVDGCARIKPRLARTCWLHEEKDAAAFQELDRLIAGGMGDKPQIGIHGRSNIS